MRTSIWMIYNCQKMEVALTRFIELNNEKIELCFTNFEDAQQIENPIGSWISDKIFKPGGWISSGNPPPMSCNYLVIKNSYSNENSQYIVELITLYLRLSFPPPVVISKAGTYIENAVIINPIWNNIPNPLRTSQVKLDNHELDKFTKLLSSFNAKPDYRYPYFEEIFKIAEIGDVFIEALCLWAFIEGFWNTNIGDSVLDQSLSNMLRIDRFPGAKKKDPRVVSIRKKIIEQNEVIGAKKVEELRNILAHGSYLKLENTWKEAQWTAIYAQRDLLLETVLRALVEYNLKS